MLTHAHTRALGAERPISSQPRAQIESRAVQDARFGYLFPLYSRTRTTVPLPNVDPGRAWVDQPWLLS